MHGALPKIAKPCSDEAIASEITRLAGLPSAELKVAWQAEFRRPAPRGMWRDLLLRTLAWRLQERAFGGHDKAALRALETYTRKKVGDQRCQRLKDGATLIRDFQGVRHTVTIVAGGFVWQQKTYNSLSAIAKCITGTNWNGPRFFGLREEKGNKSKKHYKATE